MQGRAHADDFSGHRGPDRRPAPGGLRLVEEFLNTVSGLQGGVDILAERDGLAAWLASRGLSLESAVDDADVRRAVDVREAMRALLADPDAASVEARSTIERAAVRAQLALCFDEDGELRLVARAAGVDGRLGAIVSALYEGLVDGTARRLRVCRNHGCRWAFYDHSRNGAARWCSMTVCGARSKARDYRRRRAATGGSESDAERSA